MHTVLILGARGRFGSAAANAFARAGWRVLAQARPGSPPPSGSHPRITWLPLALDDRAALLQAASGAPLVLHALNPSQYTDTAWQREAPVFLETALDLAQALGATLMMPGNVYNHGRALPAVLNEDSPQAPDHAKAHIRVALEQRLQQAATESGVRSVVIRAGDFFGQGRGSWLDLVIAKDLARGVLTLPGPRNVPHAWAYLPDLADTFVRVAEQRHRLPPCASLLFQGHTLTLDEWVDQLQLGRPPLRVKALPWAPLRVLALVSPTLRSLCAMRYLWQRPHRLDNTRLRALIGDEPHTAFPVALGHSLAALGMAPAPQATLATA
jgi:nucleoside-diphosphate-sugar epimerase